MQITIDDFILENVFRKVDTGDGVPVWYTRTFDQDGWIVLYPDGEHFHTYRYPPDFLENI